MRLFHLKSKRQIAPTLKIKPYKINLRQEACIMMTDKKLKEILIHWELKEPVKIKDLYYESSGNKSENTWIVFFFTYICSLLLDIM